MLKRVLKGELALPFNEEDLKILVNDKSAPRRNVVDVPLISYKDLPDYDTIDAVLGPQGCCFLYIQTKPSFGHWVCILRQGDTVEFFDPLGTKGGVDSLLEQMNPEWRQKSGQSGPFLSHLLHESGHKVVVNRIPLQKNAEDINSCGRWSGMRIAAHLKKLNLKTFQAIFSKRNSLDPDEAIALATMFAK
jgi:hypothetical protein